SRRAQLVLGRQRVVLTRNRALVQVNGTTLRLSAPAVVTPGGWLVPEEFLSKVVPKIAPRAHLVAARTAAPPRPAIVAVAATREAAVTDLRVRSYPSFTRVVIEADAPFTFRLERVRDGVLVRFEGLVLRSPRVEQVHDGQVGVLRLETAGGSMTAGVTLVGVVAEVWVLFLVDRLRPAYCFPSTV